MLDRLLYHIDQGVKTLGQPAVATRKNPAKDIAQAALSQQEKKKIAGLMRVNHAGEIAAQALYQGQALTARSNQVKQKMQQSAEEEVDHLAWCQERLQELGSHTSRLSVLWHSGAFCIGALAGWFGDGWSLGFVAETEHQVMQHLDRHLKKLPPQDLKSHAILQQMYLDEASHASKAIELGAKPLPAFIKKLMVLTSKIMTKTSYRW
jgi:ubiquinone biosynthesis monooxygenase Coq7